MHQVQSIKSLPTLSRTGYWNNQSHLPLYPAQPRLNRLSAKMYQMRGQATRPSMKT